MLYVIRHGQVDTNIKNQVNGWNEEKLNSVGIQQAINAGNQLKNIKIDVVFCSPLLRTRQTYNNLNIKDIPIFYDDRIKERNSNSMVYADVETLDNNIWYDGTKNIIYKDSEGFKSIINRTESILNDIKNNYKAVYLYFNPNTQDISKFQQNNCEIVCYKF